jgi:catechol 2,3-dioxygenase-like lactoylglutathione lyase family enzyme
VARLNHAGITVANLARSVEFYRDVVGMRVVDGRRDMRTQGEWFDQLTENRGAKLLVTHLEADGLVLQLVAYEAAGGKPLALAHRHPGNPHLCFDVPDLEARYERLAREGRYKLSPLVEIPMGKLASFYATDPDGVLVELMGTRSR